ncbi:hypothetical protein K239x_22240 [Planctomycetes bacterium K23_9]|uniref:Uncharacterized protein n=1 Tax=Stieleria marina TaxID=1930275 RepID=A0A517NT15_9BACT|nr:hypothetical protein K239x_22240 [Planctomycetes bacterium K23_9]
MPSPRYVTTSRFGKESRFSPDGELSADSRVMQPAAPPTASRRIVGRTGHSHNDIRFAQQSSSRPTIGRYQIDSIPEAK